MRKFDVQIALEGVAEARQKWNTAQREFQSGVDAVLDRLIHEAAVNFMSPEEFARHSGLSTNQVRALMARNGLSRSQGKTLLAKTAAEALASNAELLGIAPHEMDLMSPLAYLPMGEQLKKELQNRTVSQVHEVEEPDERHYDWCRGTCGGSCGRSFDNLGTGHETGVSGNDARSRVLVIHQPSKDHGLDKDPYCIGCWRAGGMDGAPSYPCETALAVL